ncbi:hypothetical protein HGI30_01575 [Paenibacillus albicereus]|uniref:IS1 family transposase n=1 Tax=Paenibacillus albicereus TaxID=2726185 RepID=A0A6H2GSN2_9BACL|nr:hypothetical protein [Paenibacillus albicereus]QJC50407.1 hypothetical protein HGI30_01575 [Paenibacillus albicereus]
MPKNTPPEERDRYEEMAHLLQRLQAIHSGPAEQKRLEKQRVLREFGQLVGMTTTFVREIRQGKQMTCLRPGCKGKGADVIGYGYSEKKNGEDKLHRYYCHACQHHFNEWTGSILAHRKLRTHLPAFLFMLLNEASLKDIVCSLGISRTTAVSWKNLILQKVAERSARWVKPPDGKSKDIQVSVRHLRPSRKGQRPKPQAERFISTLQIKCDSTGAFQASLSMDQPYRTQKDLPFGDQWMEGEGAAPIPGTTRLLRHTDQAVEIQHSFDRHYARMRGVAQNNLSLYLTWHGVRLVLGQFKRQVAIQEIILACLTDTPPEKSVL